jgi:radical SAM protein with 4Fe4S-binding SPASM domain
LECLDAKEEAPVLGEISDGKVKLKDNYHDTLFAKYREKFYECSDCLAYRFCKGGCPIKFLRKNTDDYAAWECSMVVEYWRSLFGKLWAKKEEEYFGWHLEKIHISECPEADVYKLKKYN